MVAEDTDGAASFHSTSVMDGGEETIKHVVGEGKGQLQSLGFPTPLREQAAGLLKLFAPSVVSLTPKQIKSLNIFIPRNVRVSLLMARKQNILKIHTADLETALRE